MQKKSAQYLKWIKFYMHLNFEKWQIFFAIFLPILINFNACQFQVKRGRILKYHKKSKNDGQIITKYSKINYFSWGIHFLQWFKSIELIFLRKICIYIFCSRFFSFLTKNPQKYKIPSLNFFRKIPKITMSPFLPQADIQFLLNCIIYGARKFRN